MNFSIFPHAGGGGGMEHRQCLRLRLRLRLMNDATHSSLSFITQLEEETKGETGCNALFAVN